MQLWKEKPKDSWG